MSAPSHLQAVNVFDFERPAEERLDPGVLLGGELELALALLGCRSPARLGPEHVRRAPIFGA